MAAGDLLRKRQSTFKVDPTLLNAPMPFRDTAEAKKGRAGTSPRKLSVKRPKNDVERAVYETFGMEPGIKRPGLIPLARNPDTGEIELTAPQPLYDLARAFAAPAVALEGGQFDPQEEALNLAMNVAGVGGARSLATRPLEGGAVELGMAGGRRAVPRAGEDLAEGAARAVTGVPQVMPPPRRIAEYVDPAATVNPEWQWSDLPSVYEKLGGLSAIPPHVADFGRFMDEQALRAGGQGLSARDLVKAFTVTRASIQRQAVEAEKLRRAGLALPEGVEGKVRPEGAFGDWLGTPAGQAYLDAAQRGQLSPNAIEDAVAGMSPFGKQNDLRSALEWAAQNLPGREGEASDLIAAGREMSSAPSEWRAFTKDIRGIGPSKSGFLASLLGRGDQPTLDARQIILNTGQPTKEASRYLARRGGLGGVEGVERLSARQAALDLALPDELRPYYQHLAHHAIWDKAGNEVTTHADVVNAMKNYRKGGLAVKRRKKAA